VLFDLARHGGPIVECPPPVSAITIPLLADDEIHVWTVPLPTGAREEAGAQLRRLLASYLEDDQPELRLTQGPHGKPELADGALHFNLSHSGAVALIAITAAAPVGIDVEQPPRRSRPNLARRICSPAELEHVAASADPDRALLRLWVRKEAVIKSSGIGLSGTLGDLRRVDVLAETLPDATRLLDLPEPAVDHPAALAHRAGRALEIVNLRLT
jgi:4'-phosphopantetheinyl transferase